MKIHNNIVQGTDEWFAIRKGKMTASHATAIGNNGKGLDTYITSLMAEFYSSQEKEQYSNKHTERGTELEPIARQIYELERDVEVEQVGFIEFDEYSGCSPDGFIGTDGGVEIKCVDDVKYFKHLLNGENEVDSDYLWQIQMNLYMTDRQWYDLIIYNPNFKQSMCVYRIARDNEKIDALKKGLEIGKEKIINIKSKINE